VVIFKDLGNGGGKGTTPKKTPGANIFFAKFSIAVIDGNKPRASESQIATKLSGPASGSSKHRHLPEACSHKFLQYYLHSIKLNSPKEQRHSMEWSKHSSYTKPHPREEDQKLLADYPDKNVG